MGDAITCGGNDGTYDTWKMNFAHKKGEPWPVPVPVPQLPDMDLNVEMNTQMSKDYLLHSETLHITAAMEKDGTSTNIKEDSTMEVTEASATGPTTDDLDYSSWGTCTPAHPGHQEF